MPRIHMLSIDLKDRDLSRIEEAVLAPIRSRMYQMPTLGSVDEVVALLRRTPTAPLYFRVADDPEVFAAWEWAGTAAVVYTFEQYRLCCIDVIDLDQKTHVLVPLWQQLGLTDTERERLDASPRPMSVHLLLHERGPTAQIMGMIAYAPSLYELRLP